MKIASTQPQQFQPVTITITCETAEELMYLLSTVNVDTSTRQNSHKNFDTDVKFDNSIEKELFTCIRAAAKSAGVIS